MSHTQRWALGAVNFHRLARGNHSALSPTALKHARPQSVQDHEAELMVAHLCCYIFNLLEGCVICGKNTAKPKPPKLMFSVEFLAPLNSELSNLLSHTQVHARKKFLNHGNITLYTLAVDVACH